MWLPRSELFDCLEVNYVILRPMLLWYKVLGFYWCSVRLLVHELHYRLYDCNWATSSIGTVRSFVVSVAHCMFIFVFFPF